MNLFNKIAKYFCYIVLVVFSPLAIVWWAFADDNSKDQMYNAFHPSMQKDYVIWRWESANAAWSEVFSSTNLSGKPPLLIRFIKILMNIIISISVTMILWNWVQYIIAVWKWEDWKKLYKNILYVVIWILVALFSVVIVNILQSVSTTINKEINTINAEDIIDK